MASHHLLELHDAGYQERQQWRVRHVDLAARPGEIVTLIGPNGSGKSTTAKLALGVLKPSEGRAFRRPQLTVGYVPQAFQVDWTLPLSVADFMSLTKPVSTQRAREALVRTETEALWSEPVRGLSGGQFQRVLLARAIARQPDLLVLDEPVQGVDFAGEAAMYRLISEIRDELGCGILMISHDLHVVMAATDQVVCLNGHVCCQGAPTSVAASDAFKSLFGVRGTAELALYTHHHDHEHLPDGQVHRHTETCSHAR